MKILLLDAMNLIHRARCGFAKGEHAIVYSFFRTLKPIILKFKPDIAYFVLEGKPKHRKDLLSEYKSNRKSQPSSFWRQQKEIVEILSMMPIKVIRHPDYECDDVIANLAKLYGEDNSNDVCIVSTDTDFIQVWDTLNPNNVSLYNPVKKKFVDNPDYSYLDWKALRGDPSDNISGVPGIGDKTATKIMYDISLREKTLENVNKKEIFERNKSLIKFHWFTTLSNNLSNEGCLMNPQDINFDMVKHRFELYGFKSMTVDKYWNGFEETFRSVMLT